MQAADNAADNPISRIIIPGGPGIDPPFVDDTTGSATDTDVVDEGIDLSNADGVQPAQPNEPRKVRTVVVRPDGTIVSSEAEPAGPVAPAQTASAATAAVPVVETPEPPPLPATPPRTDNETLNVAGAGAGNSPNGELVITSVPAPGSTQQVASAPPAATTAPTTPAPSATSPRVVTPAVPAARPPTPASTQTAAVIPNGGMMVQVSSQRSDDAARATFRELQDRYPSILGDYSVNVQRADLGTRGIFFRARVGPFASGRRAAPLRRPEGGGRRLHPDAQLTPSARQLRR